MGCSLTSGGLGNFAHVVTPGASDLLYGHMVAGTVVPPGTQLLQGDQIGVQDATGHVDPCPQSGHLHFEWTGTSPAYVDGTLVSGVVVGDHPTSNNSVIGEYSASGAALRTYYASHGGFNTIGWTHANCPGACTLNMFSNLTWGRMQDFQHDPDGFGQSLATIQVANWDTSHAYRADGLIWPAWALGAWDPARGVYQPLSMARQDSGSCPIGSTPSCVTYQRFHFGYVWVNTSGQAAAAFCPDIYPLPDGDGTISATDADWAFSVFKYGPYDARADLNGDGVVSSTEPQIIFNQFKKAPHCYP